MSHLAFNDIAGYSVYYILFVITLLFALAEILKWTENKWTLVILGVIFILIAALRARGIDRDYGNYIAVFNSVGKPSEYFTHYNSWYSIEPFFYLLPSFAKLIFTSDVYAVPVFFVYAVISVTTLFAVLKKVSILPAISVMHFLAYYYLIHEMTQIRVAVVCALLIWAAYFHYHKKYRSFAIVSCIAALFHFVGLLIPALLLINPRKFSLKLNFSLVGLSLVLIVLKPENIISIFSGINIPFLQKMNAAIEILSKQSEPISIFNITNLMNVVMTSLLIINHKKLIEISPYAYLFIKMQVLSIFFFGLFSSVNYVAFRISEFWGIASVVTISYFVYCFRSKLEGYIAAVLYSFLLLIISLHVSGFLQPYRMVFMDK